jgi:hypothetical protein
MIAESRRHLVTMVLSPRYNARLKLDPAALDSKPSLSNKLQRIQEAHYGRKSRLSSVEPQRSRSEKRENHIAGNDHDGLEK